VVVKSMNLDAGYTMIRLSDLKHGVLLVNTVGCIKFTTNMSARTVCSYGRYSNLHDNVMFLERDNENFLLCICLVGVEKAKFDTARMLKFFEIV